MNWFRSKTFTAFLLIAALAISLVAVFGGTAAATGAKTSASTVPASKAFDDCLDCNGGIPSQAWFTQAKAAGYDLFIVDDITWNSEFPSNNTNDPAPASACRIDSAELTGINHAIYAGMKVAIYNRDLNCYQTALSKLGPKEHAGTSVYIWDVEQSPQLVPTAAEESKVTSDGFLNAVYTWDGATSKSIPGSGPNMPLHFNEVSNWNTPNAGAPTTVDGNPYPEINSIPNFDGWTSADIEQQSTGKLELSAGSHAVDFDSVSTAWLNSLRFGDTRDPASSLTP